MSSTAPEGWIHALPTLFAALVLLLAPGGVALRLARFPWMLVAGMAGPLSMALLVTGGVVAAAAGIAWTPLVPAVAMAALWGAAVVVGRGRPDTARPAPMARWVTAGAVVAAAVGGIPAALAMGAANAIPQAPDAIFHLGTIMTMVADHDVSVLHSMGFSKPGVQGFYPAAFHTAAATVVSVTGAGVPTAANAVALVCAFIIWPLGLMMLATEVFGCRRVIVLASSVAAVAFPAFPTWALGYGVLWPNLMGQALLPASVALVVRAVHGTGHERWLAGGAAVLLLPVLGAGHPNAVIALGALSLAIGVSALLAGSLRPVGATRRALLIASALGLVTVMGIAWKQAGSLVPSMRKSSPPGPEMTFGNAVLDVLFDGFRWQPALYVTGIAVLAGLALSLRHKRAQWVVLAAPALAVLYVLNVAVDSTQTRWLTWPWYNNSPRIAMLLVLPFALCLVATMAEGTRLLERRPAWRHRLPAAVVVVSGFLIATVGANAAARFLVLDAYYPPDDRATFVSFGELAALHELAKLMPHDAVVAANPWRGGEYLPIVGGPRTLFPTEKTLRSDPVQAVLGAHLDRVGSDARICRAARQQGVRWAITGGQLATEAPSAVTAYRGVDGVGGSRAWQPVRTQGPYTLYRLTSCLGG